MENRGEEWQGPGQRRRRSSLQAENNGDCSGEEVDENSITQVMKGSLCSRCDCDSVRVYSVSSFVCMLRVGRGNFGISALRVPLRSYFSHNVSNPLRNKRDEIFA